MNDLYNYEIEINELNKQKSILCQRKIEIQAELSAWNNKIKGKHLKSKMYDSVCQNQQSLKDELVGIEKQLIGLSSEMRDLNTLKENPDVKNNNRLGIIRILVALRDEYESFAADATRVSSMRRMAAEFSVKLTKIIKEA